MRPIVTPQKVRDFIHDLPGENTLIQGIRFPDKAIETAMEMTVAFFNEMAPPTAIFNVETFPFTFALMYGTVGQLLKGAAVGEASNALQYSADGVSVNDRETRAGLFKQFGEQFWAEFVEQCRQIKLQSQVYGISGSSFSEFYTRRGL